MDKLDDRKARGQECKLVLSCHTDIRIAKKKVAFTKPSRGMSDCESRTTISATRLGCSRLAGLQPPSCTLSSQSAFRFCCERCRLTRGTVAKQNKKVAFTLAEVLITLGIIGVIAAMTLFKLLSDYQKSITVTQLKKVYTQLDQAFMRIKCDYGSTAFSSSAAVFVKEYLMQYYNGATFYPAPPGNRKVMCWNEDNNYLAVPGWDAQYAWLNRNGGNTGYVSTPFMSVVSMELMDGTCIGFNRFNAWDRANIFVDINGSRKGPNRVGRDLFFFDIDANQKLIPGEHPLTSPDDFYSCSKTKSTTKPNGYGCTAKIIKDGWQIDNDYPWR